MQQESDDTSYGSQGKGGQEKEPHQLLDKRFSRSQFFSGAGKLAVGGMGLGSMGGLLAACGSSSKGSSKAAKAASSAAKGKVKRVAVVEESFSSFFAVNFEKPLNEYLKAKQSGWSSAFANEKGNAGTAVKELEEFAAAEAAITILSDGRPGTTFEHTVESITKEGSLFFDHSTGAVTGATQNVLFSHKEAGVEIGKAAIAWAEKNKVTAPVVGLIGDLEESQARKRTEWAWKTIKAHFSNAVLAGEVEGTESEEGAKAAANLLSAHPTMNMLICFNTIAGTTAKTSAEHAGKTDPSSFFLGVTDFEETTLKMIATGKSIMQANYVSFFPYSMILMAEDGINFIEKKKPIQPTRLILGVPVTEPSEAKSIETIVFKPLDPKNAYVYTKYFKYLDVTLKTGETPPGQ